MRVVIKFLLMGAFSTINFYVFAQSADTVRVNRQVSAFNALKVEGPFEVHIRQGIADSVSYNVPAIVSSRLVAEVSGRILTVRNKHDNWLWGDKSWWSNKSWWHTHPRLKVFITVKNLNSIKASGSCNLSFPNGLSGESLKLATRGSAVISGMINAQTLMASISGSGLIRLSGTCSITTMHISGSGNFSAKELATDKAVIKISGSGHADINANNEMDATLHGSASVAHNSNIKVISIKKSGSAEVTRL